MAHRGTQALHDENTVGAVTDSSRAGAVAEVDVRLTKDGRFVLMHDSSVNRTTTGQGLVHELTLAEIKTFRTELRGEEVPTLAEVMAAARARGTRVFLEVKTLPLEHRALWTDDRLTALADLLARFSMVESTSLYLQTDREYARMRELRPSLNYAYKADAEDSLAPESVVAQGFDSVFLPASRTNSAEVGGLNASGVAVWTRLTNDPEIWAVERSEGVERILTDKPFVFRKWCNA